MKYNLPTINVEARYNLRDHIDDALSVLSGPLYYITVSRDGAIYAFCHKPDPSPYSLKWVSAGCGDGYNIGQLPNPLPVEDWATHCYAIKPVKAVRVREITDYLRAFIDDAHPEGLVVAAEDILQRIEDAGVVL